MKPELTIEQVEHINRLLTQWHEAGRERFEKAYPNLNYDSWAYAKTAKPRRKYIPLDDGSNGAFIADRATGTVWPIKSKYGVPNKQRPIGNLWNGLDGGNLCASRWP
jgi:hypothetical protein